VSHALLIFLKPSAKFLKPSAKLYEANSGRGFLCQPNPQSSSGGSRDYVPSKKNVGKEYFSKQLQDNSSDRLL
jgi:hypothetical protein